MDKQTIQKISETEGKIITPQPDKEEVMTIEQIKAAIANCDVEVENINEDITSKQTTISAIQEKKDKLGKLLNSFADLGIKEKITDAKVAEDNQEIIK